MVKNGRKSIGKVVDGIIKGNVIALNFLAYSLEKDIVIGYRSSELIIIHVKGLKRYTIRISASWTKDSFSIKLENATHVDPDRVKQILKMEI